MPSSIQVSVNPTTNAITVTVMPDGYGSPSLTITAVGGGGTVPVGLPTSNTDGLVTWTVTPSTAGDYDVTVTCGGSTSITTVTTETARVKIASS